MSDRADSRDLETTFRPHTDAPVVGVQDVLLIDTGNDAGSFEHYEAHPPAGEGQRVDLGRGLSLGEVAHDLAELVFNACSPRGHYFFPIRQFGCRYAFVQERPLADAQELQWDPDGVIKEAVALSRLVLDNAYSFQWAARVVEYGDGERMGFPPDIYHRAYRLQDTRDWLDDAEAGELRHLLGAFWGAELPTRLRRALWRAEHIQEERYLEIALPALVVALDGLVATEREQVTRQFVTRVSALGTELGVEGVSRNFCRGMYHARSQGLHGADLDLLTVPRQSEAVVKAARLQQVLRAAVKRGIDDPVSSSPMSPGASAGAPAATPTRASPRR